MKVLIADDDAVSRRVLEAVLAAEGYEVVTARGGDEAWDALRRIDAPQLAVLDWVMSGMDGIEVCRRVRATPQPVPTYIIMLTSRGGKEDTVAGLRMGADDYLTKPCDRAELCARVGVGARMVRMQRDHAERVLRLERAEAELRNLSLTDDLTGLCNRRGFLAHAEQHLKEVRRSGREFLLFYADMDGLKRINDTFGHVEGSFALAGVAEVLRGSFREPDTVARLGGDEFAVLARDVTAETAESITSRLQQNLRDYNARQRRGYELSLSLGVLRVTPDASITLEGLLAQADRLMYEHKRGKQQPPSAGHAATAAGGAARGEAHTRPASPERRATARTSV